MDDSFSFEGFFEGAKKAAYKAMDDHARGEYDEFALHAGVAIERLAKAVLYKLNPLYIASGKVHLSGQKARIYTITATEALSRLSSLNILKVDADLKLLIEQRNGTVHASVGDEAKTHIPTLAKAVGPMLKHLGISDHDFWDRWTSAVNVAVDRLRSEIERGVALRIKQARHIFDDRFKDLPDGVKEKLLQEHQPSSIVSVDTIAFTTDGSLNAVVGTTACPACGGRANLTLRPVTAADAADDFTASALECPLCRLRLTGSAEIRASGADVEKAIIPTSISVKQRSGSPNEITEFCSI
ncbi:hypothetical protein [Streptomyces similanensis]|uniref:DUF4145 domain-containing protein n=1 Tax=Streptomyces similanensis TaxID=1274988 RepID=A0ABP9LLV0_9ACTN